jgi:hypothetical protein
MVGIGDADCSTPSALLPTSRLSPADRFPPHEGCLLYSRLVLLTIRQEDVSPVVNLTAADYVSKRPLFRFTDAGLQLGSINEEVMTLPNKSGGCGTRVVLVDRSCKGRGHDEPGKAGAA